MQIEQLTFYNTIIKTEFSNKFWIPPSFNPIIFYLSSFTHFKFFKYIFHSSDCWDLRQLLNIFLFKMHWFHGDHVVMILETGATMQANISLDFAVCQENWHAFQAFLASGETSSGTVSRGSFLSSFVSDFLVSSSKCSWISSTGSLQ